MLPIAIIAASLLLAIAILIAFRRPSYYNQAVRSAIKELDQAVRHHVEVNAVLELAEQFKDRPELVKQLSEHSRQVVAAALMYRIESLGSQLKNAQDQLRSFRSSQATYGSVYDRNVREVQSIVAELLQELESANEAVQTFGGLRAVS